MVKIARGDVHEAGEACGERRRRAGRATMPRPIMLPPSKTSASRKVRM
jgi:hypothetical protein